MQAELAAQRAIEAELEQSRAGLAGANEAFNTVQGRYYKLGADVARLEQAIKHGRESRQQQQQELARAEQTLGEIGEHIERDVARLEDLAREIARIEPGLAEARRHGEETAGRLQEAEQAMRAWQVEWDEFTGTPRASQSVQVERTRIDHLERHLQQVEGRLERLHQEQQVLDGATLDEEVEQLTGVAREQEELAAEKQSLLLASTPRIADIRSGIERHEQEVAALQSTHHDRAGTVLLTLQQAALGQRSELVSGWLESRGLKDAPRLAQEIDVEKGWEHAVETALGFYLEAVCVDGLEDAEAMLAGLRQGAIALFDTRATGAAARPAARWRRPARSVPWSMAT
jgi:chromosome segregation protein